MTPTRPLAQPGDAAASPGNASRQLRSWRRRWRRSLERNGPAPTLSSFDFGIRSFDSLWYHLPWAASFAQSGQITTLHFTDVEYLTAFYPATAELFHGLGIVLFARDTLSPALNLVWLALVLLAAYCVGRPRGLGVATLLGAALALAIPMMVLSQAGSAANDIAGVFFVLASVAILMNRPGSRRALVLAAISAGLAVSVKLSMLAPVLGLRPRRPRARARRDSAAASAPCGSVPLFLAGGFWYLRNLIAVGNPLPWVSLPGPRHSRCAAAGPHRVLRRSLSDRHPRVAGAAGAERWPPASAHGGGRSSPAVVLGPLLCLLPGASAAVRMLGLVALGLDPRLPDHARERRRPGRPPARFRLQSALRGARADPLAGGPAPRPRIRRPAAAGRRCCAVTRWSCSSPRWPKPTSGPSRHLVGQILVAARRARRRVRASGLLGAGARAVGAAGWSSLRPVRPWCSWRARVRRTAQLSAQPLRLPARRLRPQPRVGLLPSRPPRARRSGRNLRRLLRLSPVRRR